MKQVLTPLAFLLASAGAATASPGGHGTEHPAGLPASPEHAARTVEITMLETGGGGMIFEPAELAFRKGETVLLKAVNGGEMVHELVLDTKARNAMHGEMMKKGMEGSHASANAITLAPGETGGIAWTFSNAGTFEFACLIPGHYEAGMSGTIAVE
ncbi:cupredoxin domain-containing protein [Cribrihabitans pelagius]|uniref:cupredoxin domain-containing protein n=1 Tax=Cribrihabitans pelagius TaxID=1765746 RepID=UPI003B5C5C68